MNPEQLWRGLWTLPPLFSHFVLSALVINPSDTEQTPRGVIRATQSTHHKSYQSHTPRGVIRSASENLLLDFR